MQPSPDSLSFAHLEKELARLMPELEDRESSTQVWSARIGWAGAVFGILMIGLAFIVEQQLQMFLVLATVGLGIEITGFAVWIFLSLREIWPGKEQIRREFATQLDSERLQVKEALGWLKEFESFVIEDLLRYVRSRREMLSGKLSLLTGGVERLGVLPVVVAVFLQIRSWQWGDWAAIADVNFTSWLGVFLIGMLYLGGWRAIAIRHRLDAYEYVLAESLISRDAGAGKPQQRVQAQ